MLKRTRVIVLSMVMLALFTVTVGAYQALMKKVVVIDNGVSQNYSTNAEAVSELLKDQNIKIGEYDELNVPLNSKLQDNQVITIKRAMSATISIDGLQTQTMTCKATVGELLDEKHVVLGEKDKINWSLSQSIRNDINIEIQTYQELTMTETETIPFSTEEKETKEMLIGERKITQTGKDGEKVKTYKVIYIGGKETGKELINETITQKPINTVTEIGIGEPVKPIEEPIKVKEQEPAKSSDSQAPKNYSKVMTLKATAYTPNDGGGHGITYSGMPARFGVVAVDPNVIPLYTKLYIEGYGEAIAGDTGGSIKGNRIDLCYESYDTVKKFGVRNVKVYILD